MSKRLRRWLVLKSHCRRYLMKLLDCISTYTTVSIRSERIPDYVDPNTTMTELSVEFRIYRHTYHFGRGSRGLSLQVNVTQIDCIRHYLDEQFNYRLFGETFYGLDPDEYSVILKDRIHNLDKESGDDGRWYVKKRRGDTRREIL